MSGVDPKCQRVVRGASGGIVENGHPDSREQVFTTGTEMTLAEALAAGVAVVADDGSDEGQVQGAYVEPIPVPEPPDDDSEQRQVAPPRRVKAEVEAAEADAKAEAETTAAAKPKAKAKAKAKPKAKAKAKAN